MNQGKKGSGTSPFFFPLAEAKVIFWSMFYNEHCNINYAIDTLFEPMFWFVDNYVSFLGKAFTLFLFFMAVLVILIGYLVVAPYEWRRKSTAEIAAYVLVGHWILLNFAFNYFMAYTVEPGLLPKGCFVDCAVSICKNCVKPKPPRTHHCSICNKCILKMDHHCPWLDQCIGFYNHRYFFLYMVYMWLGCLFIVVGMRCTFADHYWLKSDVIPWCLPDMESYFLFYLLCYNNMEIITSRVALEAQKVPAWQSAFGAKFVRYCILVEYLVVCGMVLGLFALISWHAHLISYGETSIERHINGAMRAKYKNYINPYDFGVASNWKKFLAIRNFRSDLLVKVLLPSVYKPEGNGIHWESVDKVAAWLHDKNYDD